MGNYKYNPIVRKGFENIKLVNLVSQRVDHLENITLKISIYEPITTISGTITPPTGAQIYLAQFLNGEDALVCGIQNNRPTFQDSGDDVTNFDITGNYTVTGLSTNPAALIYYIQINLVDLPNIPLDKLTDPDQLLKDLQLYNLDELLDVTYPTPPVDTEVLQRNATGNWINTLFKHNDAIDRNVADCHPITAITGLSTQITTYIHNQLIPSNSWTIPHNLGKFPSITVVDSSNSTIIGDAIYIDNNNITLNFSSPFSGKAYLN